MVRPGPVDRLRARLASRRGPPAAGLLPDGYQRLGRVVLVRWPEALRPEFPALAADLAAELRCATVLRVRGPVEGERRIPSVETLFGSSSETEVLEDGVRFRFDAARLLYSAGNRAERSRLARLPSPTETVVDLFAGIGYFALPIARHARPRRLVAIEENPESFAYLEGNIARNRLGGRVEAVRGDNRQVGPAPGSADRVLLGYLPDSLPWIPRALSLLVPSGGTLHVHLLEGSAAASGSAESRVRAAIADAGATAGSTLGRRVKSYGPGREHWVVDARVEGGVGPGRRETG